MDEKFNSLSKYNFWNGNVQGFSIASIETYAVEAISFDYLAVKGLTENKISGQNDRLLKHLGVFINFYLEDPTKVWCHRYQRLRLIKQQPFELQLCSFYIHRQRMAIV